MPPPLPLLVSPPRLLILSLAPRNFVLGVFLLFFFWVKTNGFFFWSTIGGKCESNKEQTDSLTEQGPEPDNSGVTVNTILRARQFSTRDFNVVMVWPVVVVPDSAMLLLLFVGPGQAVVVCFSWSVLLLLLLVAIGPAAGFGSPARGEYFACSKVGTCPRRMHALLARVKATLSLRKSFKNPTLTDCERLARTKETITTSLSLPWKESTVATLSTDEM